MKKLVENRTPYADPDTNSEKKHFFRIGNPISINRIGYLLHFSHKKGCSSLEVWKKGSYFAAALREKHGGVL